MAYTYKGTHVWGDTSEKTNFYIPGATLKVGQTYLNTTYGHVYKCTEVLKTKHWGKFKYDHTDIIKAPAQLPYGLICPVRTKIGSNTRVMNATWKIAPWASDKKNGARAENVDVRWAITRANKNSEPPRWTYSGGTGYLASNFYFVNAPIGNAGKKFTRASFYPLTSRKLYTVSVSVRLRNRKGSSKWVSQSRTLLPPRAPSISAISFNNETGRVSATIKTNAGEDAYERYDTRYTVKVKNTRTGKTWNAVDTASTSTEFSTGYNVSDYQQLTYGQYVQVTITAWARGLAGDSNKVSRTIYVAYPTKTTITSVAVSSKKSDGKCTINLKTNSTTAHPVDRVKLEYLANCEYASAAKIPGDAAWTTSDIIDDAACTALAISVSELIPDAGKYTWVRVKSYHLNEAVLYRYSEPIRVKALETPAPTAADDKIKILSATAGDDGKSAVVLLGWNQNGKDDSTGTELTWSNDVNAWKSTKSPSLFEFEWSDGQVTVDKVTYISSATVYVRDLDEGETYYFRARRYMEGDTKSYSPFSNRVTCITSETPEAIVATCDRYVSKGGTLAVRWTFSGNGLQKEWQIVSKNKTVIAKGEGSIGAAYLTYDRLLTFAANNSLTFTVQASTGSGFVISEEHTVVLIENPELDITSADTLTVQPFSFTAAVSSICNLIVIVTSQGLTGNSPLGTEIQTAGDTIHSDVYAPEWTETDDGYTATITLPERLDFWDTGNYTLSVTAVDRDTELSSEELTANFKVAWAHQAPDPTDYITLTEVDETEEDGKHLQAVQIALTAPNDASDTDLYDIYRMDGGRPHLIGQGFPLEYTAVDEYAPFGTDEMLYYRIALRTADGDVMYADKEYHFESDILRFDWADGTLEFPYDITVADSYAKDVDIRSHMDGSVDGYWNQNVQRKGSLSTKVIKLVQPTEIETARRLARYTGPVFVRTPNGSAYEADVQVTGLSAENKAVTAISIDATEIDITNEFMLPTPYMLTDSDDTDEEDGE